MSKTPPKPPVQDAYRSSKTGQFVTEKYANKHPATTEHEHFRPNK